MISRRWILGAWFCAFFAFVGFCAWSIIPLWRSIPEPRASTVILARDGSVLADLGASGARQVPIRLEDLSNLTIRSVLAAEDARFWEHRGIDWRALGSATVQNIRARSMVRGASTIEQQVVGLVYFPEAPRSIMSKYQELIAARYWAATHTKEETLEVYLNRVPLGRVNGFGAGSREFFDVDASQLSFSQSAMLAGMISAPSAYNPLRFRDRAELRQAFVFDRMAELGWANASDLSEARRTSVTVRMDFPVWRVPHLIQRLLSELEATYPDLRNGGYRIATTIDPGLQQTVERAISNQLRLLDSKDVDNAAAYAMDPKTGEVLAYVGSADFENEAIQGQVDLVQALRQPGSSLKPFLAYFAFLQGYTPASVIPDIPSRFEGAESVYEPQNYDRKFHGSVSIRDALGSSLNVPFVVLLDRLGLDPFVGLLREFGLEFPQAPSFYGLSMVLGGGEVQLEDVVRAYARLLTQTRVEPVLVLRVERLESVVQEAELNPFPELVPDDRMRAEQASALVRDVLTDPDARLLSFGRYGAMNVGVPGLALKTGTTKDFRDNWAFGVTPNLAMGVWVGHADNRPMRGVSGVTGAVPILAQSFRAWHAEHPAPPWQDPPGLIRTPICVDTGLPPTLECARVRQEWVISSSK